MTAILVLLAAAVQAATPVFTSPAARRLTQPEAVKYCAKRGMALPVTREFGMLAQSHGSKGLLEVSAVTGAPPEGYYKVDSQDGDTFYFNNSGYKAPDGPLGSDSFWTATIVTGKPKYAHVYYGKLGGGGGTPEEHLLTHKHAVVCVVRKK